MSHSILRRDQQIATLSAQSFDVAVIGGGINGAAVARDAAMRGLAVALIDRGDFAGQTSSRSTKLIHGGLRYLPQRQLHLVFEALRERERLRRITAPHLVKVLQFLFPVYSGGPSRLALAAGLSLYDLMARTPGPERHRMLSAAKVKTMEPCLTCDELSGGAVFCDAQADDARLTLENVLDTALHGGAVANYLALEEFGRNGSRLQTACVHDLISGKKFEIRSRLFVNATGPWIDDVRRLSEPGAQPSVRLTKGVHLVFSRRNLPIQHSLMIADGHGRIIFAIRHEEAVLVGTTDTDFHGDRMLVDVDDQDIEYLLATLRRAAPGLDLSREHIGSSFAGLRTLIDPHTSASPSEIPREEIILQDSAGLISIAGGKLTTHRRIAQRLVDRLCARLDKPVGPCLTQGTPLPGARPLAQSQRARIIKSESEVLLRARYGSAAEQLFGLIAARPELEQPLVPGCPVMGAEVVHAARAEMAVKLQDFVARRAAITWRFPWCAAAAVKPAASLMGIELGWSLERRQAETQDTMALLQNCHIS